MKIALAADLHFGSVPIGLAEQLSRLIQDQHPDVIAIAGDLTLRARSREFEEAKLWLQSLKPPTLVIPGNHDLPFWNLLQRFADPFHRYRHAASAETLMPVLERPDGVLLGFNTTGPWQPHMRWQEGVARVHDIVAAEAVLKSVSSDRFKALAGHHPFVTVPAVPRAEPVRRATRALRAFAEAGVDLLMSGHTHQSFAIETRIAGKTIVAVGAPTALSSRMRGEANGFWIIEGDTEIIDCELWLRREALFEPVSNETFRRIAWDR